MYLKCYTISCWINLYYCTQWKDVQSAYCKGTFFRAVFYVFNSQNWIPREKWKSQILLWKNLFDSHKWRTLAICKKTVPTKLIVDPFITFSMFLSSQLAYFAFLALFSYIMLSNKFTTPEPSIEEYVLMAWVFTLFVEEFRQVRSLGSGGRGPQHLVLYCWFRTVWITRFTHQEPSLFC